MINDDILEGKAKQVEGKVQDAYGDLTDNPKDDIQGKAKVAEGNAQEGKGHIKAAIENAVKNADREPAGRV
jgi:uncharacterized protein YjbJ (UPF0337 family)